ncbi:threonine--tRNA ligase [Candidatus Pacearchaeota archaeon]|nr:threonine--tRNA ligase [Candidatus Pacearchaeota archaeon]
MPDRKKSKEYSNEYLDRLRHSCAHLLAAAVIGLFPKAKRTIGPPIENGFYYDFDFGEVELKDGDLPGIEGRMAEILKTWKSFQRKEVTASEAKKEFKNNEYKLELIDEFSKDGQKLTLYKSGNYTDLCRGGHVDNPSKDITAFKLLKIAGAYWRGSEKNKMLTRIYGTCFPTQKELDEHLKRIEEAEKRDHRKLGKELGLFTFSELVGSGLPLYTPDGAFVRIAVNNYVESVQSAQDYTQVWTPQMTKAKLFKISGHYDKYKDAMFKVSSSYSNEEFFLKPMNCPQHTQIYSAEPHSYRDLPLRFSDFSMLYRDEKPGELSGLSRVRAFSQDDCHIFCTEEQVDEEIDKALTMTKEIINTFGLKYKYRLSTRDQKHPEKYLGNPEIWDRVEAWAVKIMKRNKIEYFDGPGEAAFYAPKMDLIATDALGREWQLSTIQIDFVMPERFGLEYAARDGTIKRPVMIHRAIIGSPERFMMIMLEHFAGAFPVWLSPNQAIILPISEKFTKSAEKTTNKLKKLIPGLRVKIDLSNETLQKKIRNAQLKKIPYMLIVGEKEEKAGTANVRLRGGEIIGEMKIEKIAERIKKMVEEKSLAL